MSYNAYIHKYDKNATMEYGYYDKIETDEIAYIHQGYPVRNALRSVKRDYDMECGVVSRIEILKMIPYIWGDTRYFKLKITKQLIKALKYRKVMITLR